MRPAELTQHPRLGIDAGEKPPAPGAGDDGAPLPLGIGEVWLLPAPACQQQSIRGSCVAPVRPVSRPAVAPARQHGRQVGRCRLGGNRPGISGTIGQRVGLGHQVTIRAAVTAAPPRLQLRQDAGAVDAAGVHSRPQMPAATGAAADRFACRRPQMTARRQRQSARCGRWQLDIPLAPIAVVMNVQVAQMTGVRHRLRMGEMAGPWHETTPRDRYSPSRCMATAAIQPSAGKPALTARPHRRKTLPRRPIPAPASGPPN